MSKCYADSSCEGDHAVHGEMLHNFKGFDAAQGLVCLLDAPWGRVFDKAPCCVRQSLVDFYGYEYVSVEASSIPELQAFSRPSRDVFGKSAEAEWKWILYHQQASLCDFLTPIKSTDRYAPNMLVDSGSSVKGDVKQVAADLSFANVLCAASKVESCPYPGISKPQRVNMIQPFESSVAGSTNRGILSWQAANSKQFAATISHRRHAHAESCGLPPLTVGTEEFGPTTYPQGCAHTESHELSSLVSSFTWGEEFGPTTYPQGCAHTESHKLSSLVSSFTWGEDCAVDSSADFSVGKDVLLERKLDLEISSLRSTPPCELVSGVTGPSSISAILQEPFVDGRSSHPFGDENTVLKANDNKYLDAKKCEILGEALCHAQTRARHAEKAAAQALQDRDRLARLLSREAWITYMYKQRARILELENRLLKLCLNIDIEVRTGSESTYLVEQTAQTSWRPAQKRHPFLGSQSFHSLQDESGKSSVSWKERVVLSCALGLAFVLGLSIAGAGLMFGWSMGWMLFS